jgi:hypothetical protein
MVGIGRSRKAYLCSGNSDTLGHSFNVFTSSNAGIIVSSGTSYRVALVRTDVETLKMKKKRRFELVLHYTKSQKTSLIDTAVKASKKTSVLRQLITVIMVLNCSLGANICGSPVFVLSCVGSGLAVS